MRAFNENRFKYNWHWFWDTGNGDLGNQGVHQMDIALWGLGVNELPHSVMSTGGKYVYDDDQETPNTQIATFDYGPRELVFEVRGLLTGTEGAEKGVKVGNLFYGSDGLVALNGGSFQVFKGEKNELAMEETGRGGDGNHIEELPGCGEIAQPGFVKRRSRHRNYVGQTVSSGEHQLPPEADAFGGQ